MNKADYIHILKEACGGKCNAEYNPCIYRQAADNLAASKLGKWVGLTDDEVDACFEDHGWSSSAMYHMVVHALEAKLK